MNQTNIPTPRTDEKQFTGQAEWAEDNAPLIDCVKAVFARQLETELTQLTIAYQKAVADGLELKRQRDEWKEDAERLAERLQITDNHLLHVTGQTSARINNHNALAAHNKLMEQMNKSLAEHPD